MSHPQNPIKNISCPKCKKEMSDHGSLSNSYYYCKNVDCEYCGIERVTYPWEIPEAEVSDILNQAQEDMQKEFGILKAELLFWLPKYNKWYKNRVKELK